MKNDSATRLQHRAARTRCRASDVLALVAESTPGGPAAELGARLAKRWQGTLTACHVPPALRPLSGAPVEPTVLSLLYEDDTDAPARAARDFHAWAATMGVDHAHWVQAASGIAQTLHVLGAWHDLAVMQRELIPAEHLVDVLGEALLGARIPCLIIPAGRAADVYARVLIGWNGRQEAAHALRAALPLLAEAREVVLADGSHPAEDDLKAWPPFAPREYLLGHGIEAHAKRLRADPKEAGAALLREAEGYDLLVIGAYSHSRTRERLLGGATRHVLAHAQLPLLMMH